MLLNAQNTTDHSTHLMTYLEKRFLDRLLVKFHFDKFAKKQKLGKNMGKSVTWTRWANLSESVVALTEGESPDGVSLSSAQVTAVIAGYGQYATTTDFLDLVAINDQMKDMVDLLGYAAGKSLDALVRNTLDAGGTVAYADAANNDSVAKVQAGTDTATTADFRAFLKTLHAADVEPFDDGLLKGIIHPIMEFDLLGETSADSVLQISANTSASQVKKGFIGNILGVDLYRSTHIRTEDAPNGNVYKNIIVGKNSYGIVDLESAGLEMIIKQLGSGGTEDPLNQRATVGYKVYHANAILDADRIIVYKVYGA